MRHTGKSRTPNGAPEQELRVFKVAMKAARFCLDNAQMGLCQKVVEHAADYVGEGAVIDTAGPDGLRCYSKDRGLFQQLSTEYYILRTAIAWKQGRLDLAEHMYKKAATSGEVLAEKQADLLFEIGKDLLKGKDFVLATKWLERALNALAEQEIEKLGPDAGELKLGIVHSLVRALIGVKNTESKVKAWDMVNLLENDFGNKMVTLLLRLELLAEADPFDAEEYFTALLRLMRTVLLTETNFQSIMHHVHKLKDHQSSELACKALDEFIVTRLCEPTSARWLEKATITRIWIGTSGTTDEVAFLPLSKIYDSIVQNYANPFSAQATHAAQTLMWKRIEASSAQKSYNIAESWCRLAQHQIFARAGEVNKTILARKMISCALSDLDTGSARQAFFEMSEAGRAAPATRYLMYKLALSTSDPELESLDIICKASSKDATYMFACVLEAQQSGCKQQAIAALQKVLERYNYSAPTGVHLPALLRCTARLLIAELEASGSLDHTIMEEVCRLFEGAASQSKHFKGSIPTSTDSGHYRAELQWFSKQAYNTSLKYCVEMRPEHLVRMLSAGIKFIDLLRKETSLHPAEDPSLRLLFCHFLCATALTALARSEDNTENSLQHYLNCRKHISTFHQLLEEQFQADGLSDDAKQDLKAKNFELLKFDLEAVLRLERWEELDRVLEKCLQQDNVDHLETLADLIFNIHSEIVKAGLDMQYHKSLLLSFQKLVSAFCISDNRSEIFDVIQRMINLTWRHSDHDIVKLSRWLRCLYQMALSLDDAVSLVCLDQAVRFCKQSQGVQVRSALCGTPGPLSILANVDFVILRLQYKDRYPKEELEWLAATSFNRAVEAYCASDEVTSRVWAEKALTVAQLAGDDLHGLLQGRWVRLTFHEDG
ncbi:sporulation-specific protein 22 [Elasticomyces elasticus]|nr:sporulation-specific protein 22 [Elasticomyces elasticus]